MNKTSPRTASRRDETRRVLAVRAHQQCDARSPDAIYNRVTVHRACNGTSLCLASFPFSFLSSLFSFFFFFLPEKTVAGTTSACAARNCNAFRTRSRRSIHDSVSVTVVCSSVGCLSVLLNTNGRPRMFLVAYTAVSKRKRAHRRHAGNAILITLVCDKLLRRTRPIVPFLGSDTRQISFIRRYVATVPVV